MNANPVVELSSASVWCGLIVEWKTGIEYSNQVAGVACLHPTIEGFLLPFDSELEAKLVEVFGEYGYWEGIDERLADEVDRLLASNPMAFGLLRVDRTRLRECYEAWVHVTGQLHSLADFGQIRGVITWENSD